MSTRTNPSIHAPRRTPKVADSPLDLHALADELLAEARELRAKRSARTLTPGAGAPVKQSLLALAAGQTLQEHLAPGPTTLLGITGTSVLTADADPVTLTDGTWAVCPTGPHTLEAVSDTVVLITVAPDPGSPTTT